MFFRRKEPTNTPSVKKASELINSKSHNQKKYISLMLVPSYSTGKTRSLRIPRAVLYGVMAGVFIISAVVMGFYLRSLHFQRVARNLNNSYVATQEAFSAFQYEAEQAQSELIDATAQMYKELSEEQQRAQREIDRQERRHQDTLEDIWDIIDELEYQLREVEEKHQDIISSLSTRSIIPPIADLIEQMEASQVTLREELHLLAGPTQSVSARSASTQSGQAISLLSFAQQPPPREDEIIHHLNALMAELDMQRQLLDNLETYRAKMGTHLSDYPTIWPVSGKISSNFGWRRNPFGRGGSEHHNGVDIPARAGTPIKAAGGGTVTFSGWQSGYGNTVIIDHGNGITTMDAHNTRNSTKAGRRVERGDVIAFVGSTGRSTGPHLHYEVRKNGTAVNPVSFLMEHHA
jgi:murein DD-endopeptidase MepM/ murein hydrolase activator NlpD